MMNTMFVRSVWLCSAAILLAACGWAQEAPTAPPPLPPPVIAPPEAPAPDAAGETPGAVPAPAPSPIPADQPAETTAPSPAASPAQEQTPAEAATATAVTRDPFWPVGHTPRSAVPIQITPATMSASVAPPPPSEEPIPKPVIEWPTLKVRGMTQGTGGKKIALIEGYGLVETDQTVHIAKGGVLYRWRVVRIEGSRVQFERLAAEPVQEPKSGK